MASTTILKHILFAIIIVRLDKSVFDFLSLSTSPFARNLPPTKRPTCCRLSVCLRPRVFGSLVCRLPIDGRCERWFSVWETRKGPAARHTLLSGGFRTADALAETSGGFFRKGTNKTLAPPTIPQYLITTLRVFFIFFSPQHVRR